MKYTNYGTHKVLQAGKYWLSLDRTGLVTWNGTRNHFLLFRKPSTRKSRFFAN